MIRECTLAGDKCQIFTRGWILMATISMETTKVRNKCGMRGNIYQYLNGSTWNRQFYYHNEIDWYDRRTIYSQTFISKYGVYRLCSIHQKSKRMEFSRNMVEITRSYNSTGVIENGLFVIKHALFYHETFGHFAHKWESLFARKERIT